MAKYDIPPLDAKVKEQYNNNQNDEVSQFFYDLNDKETHFTNSRSQYVFENPDQNKWTNNESQNALMATDVNNNNDNDGDDTTNNDNTQKLVLKARQMEDLVNTRKKALELAEERRKIAEKMKKLQSRQTTTNTTNDNDNITSMQDLEKLEKEFELDDDQDLR